LRLVGFSAWIPFGSTPRLRRCHSFLHFWLAVWVHSSASVHWTPTPVSDSASAFGFLRSHGCRGFQTFPTRVEYPMSSNKLRSSEYSVFLRFSVETQNFVFSPPHKIPYFRVFGDFPRSHGFSCFRGFSHFPPTHRISCFRRLSTDTRNSVAFAASTSSRRHTEFRSFRRFGVFPPTHGISCFRGSTELRLHV
jgi:hypothetical protein